MRLPSKLPMPDGHGTYWFGDKKADPAVFQSKRVWGDKVVSNGSFLAFAGSDVGFLFRNAELARFSTANDAFEAIKESQAKGH